MVTVAIIVVVVVFEVGVVADTTLCSFEMHLLADFAAAVRSVLVTSVLFCSCQECK